MSLSSGNRGIGVSPAISRINRFSPEKESKMISDQMRRAITLKETTASTPSEQAKAGSDDLWNPSVNVMLDPFYPAVTIKVDSTVARISDMITQSLIS